MWLQIIVNDVSQLLPVNDVERRGKEKEGKQKVKRKEEAGEERHNKMKRHNVNGLFSEMRKKKRKIKNPCDGEFVDNLKD